MLACTWTSETRTMRSEAEFGPFELFVRHSESASDQTPAARPNQITGMTRSAHSFIRKDYPIHVRTTKGIDKTAVGNILKNAFKRAAQLYEAEDCADPKNNFAYYKDQIRRAVVPHLKRDHPEWFELGEGDLVDEETGGVMITISMQATRKGMTRKCPPGVILLNVGMHRDDAGTVAKAQVCLAATDTGFCMLGSMHSVLVKRVSLTKTRHARIVRLEEDMRRRQAGAGAHATEADALHVLASLADTAERCV